jgi:uncharacterized protein (TIGR00251 family)
MPTYLQAHGDGFHLSVKLQPRAAKNEIGEAVGNELKVKVTAPPVDFAANEALLRLLSETLDCPRSAIQLVRGQTSRHKVISIHGLSADAISARLSGAS